MSGDAALSRDAFLSHVGELAEELVDLPGMGKVLAKELTGAKRALVLQAITATDGAKADFARYQELLLQHGLVDPTDGQPLLDYAGAKKAMELGASRVEKLCKAIERLSGLDASAAGAAEGNDETASGETASSASTSE